MTGIPQSVSMASEVACRAPANDSQPTIGRGLALTAMAYLPAVLCMMTVGVVVPFIDTLTRDFAVGHAQIGLSIALFSIPSAFLATLSGGLIDKYGVRRAILVSLAITTLGSALASRASSVLLFDGAMVLGGLGFAGTCVAGPCLLIAALEGRPRTRAMSFFATFAPTGYAAGLLLAVPFSDADGWRPALLTHAAVTLIAFFVLFWCLPRVRAVTHDRPAPRSWESILSVIRNARALRLAVAVALPNVVSYGTSLAAPSYLSRVHHLTIGTSSAAVATAKIVAMVVGGLSIGQLLSRSLNASLLYGVMVLVGILAQGVLFFPDSGITASTCALVVWLFAFGGMSGGAMALLPAVVRDPSRSGAASGLVNQFISVGSFAAPSIWLSMQSWTAYVLLAVGCLLVAFVALPAASRLTAR
jgi:predicted MFS family arabinose efflux permease